MYIWRKNVIVLAREKIWNLEFTHVYIRVEFRAFVRERVVPYSMARF